VQQYFGVLKKGKGNLGEKKGGAVTIRAAIDEKTGLMLMRKKKNRGVNPNGAVVSGKIRRGDFHGEKGKETPPSEEKRLLRAISGENKYQRRKLARREWCERHE